MSEKASIDALIHAGRHGEAAELALAHGDGARAAELFSETWNYVRAVEVAREAGDLVNAFHYALLGNLREESAAILAALAQLPADASRAAEAAMARGRAHDAATLYEAAGRFTDAAAAYEQSGERADAGRCLEAAGQWREAGKMYETQLKAAPDDDATALRLATILFRFARYEAATRVLQQIKREEILGPARRLLVACLVFLQMNDAAADRYQLLRNVDATLPATAAEFVKANFARAEEGEKKDENQAWLLGRYRIVRTLGSGATGRVVMARDALYDRDVAIKMLRVGDGVKGRDAFARFSREARIALVLEHPNVVRMFEFDVSGPYLVMELMHGGTLEERFTESAPLPRALVRQVISSLLQALSVVHRHGVVHRDVKPSNIFFDASGTVKLGDFGVAHLTEVGATLTGAMLGTLAYMAPEQITGSTTPMPGTDLYAIGIIAYRMLTGELPFRGPDFVAQHLNETAVLPSAKNAGLGTDYDGFIARLLAKDPKERPSSCDEALALLNTIRRSSDDVSHASTILNKPAPRIAPDDAQSQNAARYARPVDPTDAERAFDRVLERNVRIVKANAEERAWWKKLASLVHPNLQLVLDIDEANDEVWLEDPRYDAAAVIQFEAIEKALQALHQLGVAHGAVDASHIVTARGRSVLLLPRNASQAPASADLEALAHLRSALGRHRAKPTV
ncbi:MAG: protein kinase [Sandaracinaceae bacterium]|nr:protein kinase [Sandaracinaceae bacterium]